MVYNIIREVNNFVAVKQLQRTTIKYFCYVQSTQSVDQTAQPTASSQQQTAVKRETNQYELLGEREILALIKNFKELDDGEKSDLLQYMKELERKDPVKVKRLKRKMYEK